ncbi:MAG: hypothetical protein RBT03_10155 [Kiritimatiellia bacterium]|nr:hypothetical protein [Kiritimatiellia bacterium]
MLHLARPRTIPVSFCDRPGHSVDKSLFDVTAYTDLNTNGLRIRPLGIIHAAALHYTGKFPSNKPLRLLNAFIDIFANVDKRPSPYLHIHGSESPEFQSDSTEIIAVGICLAATSRLFAVPHNRISPIITSGKRCDYRFTLNNLSYLVESKGRKGALSAAIKDIFLKKDQYPRQCPKYGMITHVPRDCGHVDLRIYDPEYEPKPVPQYILIKQILSHYARTSYLSGFWRMGDLLMARTRELTSDSALAKINGVSLQYGNIYKLGHSLGFTTGSTDFDFFVPRDSKHGLRIEYKGNTAFFAMDSHLLEILEKQLFENILEYSFMPKYDNFKPSVPYSSENDGSLLMMLPTETLQQLT